VIVALLTSLTSLTSVWPGWWGTCWTPGAFLGWIGFDPAEDGRPDDEVELGYRLRRAAWGKGYATEGSRALIGKAFDELGVRRVFAQTMAVNLASRRVMEKSGLRFVRTFHLTWVDTIPGTEYGEMEYALDGVDH
jgi:RimJ/RimL family protein N-acetyltransferase